MLEGAASAATDYTNSEYLYDPIWSDTGSYNPGEWWLTNTDNEAAAFSTNEGNTDLPTVGNEFDLMGSLFGSTVAYDEYGNLQWCCSSCKK